MNRIDCDTLACSKVARLSPVHSQKKEGYVVKHAVIFSSTRSTENCIILKSSHPFTESD